MTEPESRGNYLTYLFLNTDVASRADEIILERGHHCYATWFDALMQADGPVACIVVNSPTKPRTLLLAKDVSIEIRCLACDWAERALKASRISTKACWDAITIARQFSDKKVTVDQLMEAGESARIVATDVVRHAAWDVTRLDAAAATRNVAWFAARTGMWLETWEVARQEFNSLLHTICNDEIDLSS